MQGTLAPWTPLLEAGPLRMQPLPPLLPLSMHPSG
jgi:hypothetical protein